MGMLRIAVLLAAAWALLALLSLHRWVMGYGRRALFSRPAGDPVQGAVYAFTWGMAPWAKESVMLNLPSFVAGLAFHGGLAAGLALLLAALLRLPCPAPLLFLARGLTLAGTAGGLVLFAKRLIRPHLRGLSSPDDFAANALCSGFILLAFGSTCSAALEPAWMVEAALLLVYLPLGKIRHCLFFFTSRYQLGAFFGRRGTFPPGGSAHA
jgi:hypothetical protein